MKRLVLLLFIPWLAHAGDNAVWVQCIEGLSKAVIAGHKPLVLDFSGYSYSWDGQKIREVLPLGDDKELWSLARYHSNAGDGRLDLHIPSKDLRQVQEYIIIQTWKDLSAIKPNRENARSLEAAYQACGAVDDIKIFNTDPVSTLAKEKESAIRDNTEFADLFKREAQTTRAPTAQ